MIEARIGDSARSPGLRKIVVHAVLGAVGLAALGLLVRSVGWATLFGILRGSARWLPLLFAIDALRVVAEAAATYSLSDRVRARVPIAELARIHLVGFAIAVTMPAGRAAAEAVKAAMLSRFLGVPEAAAVGVASQSTAMLGGALGAIPCIAAALWLTGPSPLTGAVAATALLTAAGFALFQIACRRPRIGGALIRRFTGMAEATAAFQGAMARIPVVPRGATLAALVNRALVAVELGLLLGALGGRHGVGAAFLAQGVGLVGGVVGDFVPGQLGAADGAFALAAPYLGLALADGVAVAVMLHCVQAIWAVIGWTVPFFWKAPPRESPQNAPPAPASSAQVLPPGGFFS